MVMSVASLGEQRTVLRHITWSTFESLLKDMGEHRASRLIYDRGTLEIMTPLYEHEKPNRVLAKFVDALGEELNIEVSSAGSTTLKRRDLERGSEPDSSFYIENERFVRGKKAIDLRNDPPPDLVIEIDITSSSLDSFEIYASLGVPEIWRYDGKILQFFWLEDGKYLVRDRARSFPFLPVEEVSRFLEMSQTLGETSLLREFRAWVRSQLENQGG